MAAGDPYHHDFRMNPEARALRGVPPADLHAVKDAIGCRAHEEHYAKENVR
jgi:hypothetical protein